MRMQPVRPGLVVGREAHHVDSLRARADRLRRVINVGVQPVEMKIRPVVLAAARTTLVAKRIDEAQQKGVASSQLQCRPWNAPSERSRRGRTERPFVLNPA